MSVQGLLFPTGSTFPALLSKSISISNSNSNSNSKSTLNSNFTVFHNPIRSPDRFSHSLDKRAARTPLRLSSSRTVGCRKRSSRSVSAYYAGWQSGWGSERGGKQNREVGGGFVPEIVEEHEEPRVPRRTVAVFWDLDNKPPNLVPPYEAALRLKRLAGEFGDVVDLVAYANQNAFSYVPTRVREERQDRRMLDQLEKRGVVRAERPYICSMCGRRSRTNVDLKKHFKQLHERERNKRLAYLGQLKGKKRTKYLEKVAMKEDKYKQAARTVLIPKVGYGLAAELKRAGVSVRTVEKRPQAADEALLRHMNLYINRGIECICLVSDDSDFLEILKFARSKRVVTVVVGDTGTLKGVSDCSFSWQDVATGRAVLAAHERVQRWANEDALRAELHDDDDDDDEEFGDDDDDDEEEDSEEEFREFQRNVKSSLTLSPFADDEDGYRSNEEEEEDQDDNENENDEEVDDEDDVIFGGRWDTEVEGTGSPQSFH